MRNQETLFPDNRNIEYVYIVLFGKLKLIDNQTSTQVGRVINLGWTIGEESLLTGSKARTSMR